jgi:hypothetical protein
MIAVKDMPAGQRLYRGVRCPERPEKISRISYPPADIASLGRLNRPDQPKFYCSAGGPPVFYELHAQRGDLIGFSEWETTEPLWVHNLDYHPRALIRIGAQSGTIDMRYRVTHAIADETRVNEKIRYQISKAFTADVPKGNEYRYKQTIAINESLSEVVYVGGNFLEVPKNPKIAGTVYPAMKMHGDADNVALPPEFVDISLRLVSVRYVKVEETNETSSSTNFLPRDRGKVFRRHDQLVKCSWSRGRSPNSYYVRKWSLGYARWAWAHLLHGLRSADPIWAKDD